MDLDLFPYQKKAIDLASDGQDVVVNTPTGSGKSLVYQRLARQNRVIGCTVVFEPLIALIRDQERRAREAGLGVVALHGQVSDLDGAMKQLASPETEIVFCTPERLSKRGVGPFQKALEARGVSHIVLDESHVLPDWERGFRPAYRLLGPFRHKVQPVSTLVLSATLNSDMLGMIKRSLRLENVVVVSEDLDRPNLTYEVVRRGNLRGGGDGSVLDFVNALPRQGVLFVLTVAKAEALMARVRQEGWGGWTLYHGEMTSKERHASQDRFMSGGARVCIATKAFGLGIDKSDIRWTFHRHLPLSVEDLLQETGRAGRDGLPARCYVYDAQEGYANQQALLESSNPSVDTLKAFYDELHRQLGDGRDYRPVSIMGVARAANIGAFRARGCRTWLEWSDLAEFKRHEVHGLGIRPVDSGAPVRGRVQEGIWGWLMTLQRDPDGWVRTDSMGAAFTGLDWDTFLAGLRALKTKGRLYYDLDKTRTQARVINPWEFFDPSWLSAQRAAQQARFQAALGVFEVEDVRNYMLEKVQVC